MDRLMSWADGLGKKKTLLLALAGAPIIILLLFLSNKFLFPQEDPAPQEPTISKSLALNQAIGRVERNIGRAFYLQLPRYIVRFDDGGKRDRAGLAYLRSSKWRQLQSDPLAFSYLLLQEKSSAEKTTSILSEATKQGGWKREGDGWVAVAIPGETYNNFPAIFLAASDGSIYARLIASPDIPSDRKSQEKLLDLLRLR